jgi:hydrogenase maturation protease
MHDKTLVVGIGSPYGDDRVGWKIAEQIAQLAGDRLVARCARTPAEMLDWLDEVVELHVCDAFVQAAAIGEVRHWQWPAPQIAQTRFRGSHDFSLSAVLALAEQLRRLPARVSIWGIAIDANQNGETISPAVKAAVPVVVERILGALAYA